MITGSTRVGFIKDRISGEITFEDDVDGAMPPVEDMDDSDNELEDIDDDDDVPEFINEEKVPMSHLPPTTPPAPGRPRPAPACKERDDALTARQLRIALSALCEGLRQASRFFVTEPPLIRSWLKDARRRLKSSEREQKWDANGGDLMVAWVLSMREQQLPITESNLFHKASTLKKKGGFSDSFRISYDWAVGFMLRHRLGFRSSGRAATLAHALPLSLEAKIKAFREFTQKVIRLNELPEGAVAAMDELCLFVDLRFVQDKSRCSEALQLTGSLPLVTVYLAVLADGTMLPSLVLANRQLAQKVLPDFILLETGPEKLLVEETLNLWTNKVWLKHLAGPSGPSKSLLVLDRHREHTGDAFLAAVSGSGTLPAVIPGGDSFRLQPLEMCMKPVLQRFLLSRWAQFTRGTPAELQEAAPLRLQATVAQLLVDWAVEALAQLNKLPQLWRESFRLTGLLPGRELQEATARPEQIQADFLKTLTETLLGPEALEADYSELLELEDKEDTEEEPGEGKEVSEEKEGEGKEASEEKEGEGKEATEEKEGEGKEATEEKEGEGKEASEQKKGKEVKKEREEIKEEGKEGKKEGRPGDTENETIKGEEERKKTDENMKKEVEKLEEDSGEEGKETEEDSKEVSKERRETRIVIGEEVGDEWKIKSRADGLEES
ncbi:Pogo transposable element with ZNF domain [Liparis tanakae]|uniref:Pogo transposable element with ZNF domain n=1 Tax=Liparis tanakae TaxID=230148 RepID=A0A4Z2EMG5_9TELE|nr:Pogo transposable element with ZNF domain [Liparis tanakae]